MHLNPGSSSKPEAPGMTIPIIREAVLGLMEGRSFPGEGYRLGDRIICFKDPLEDVLRESDRSQCPGDVREAANYLFKALHDAFAQTSRHLGGMRA